MANDGAESATKPVLVVDGANVDDFEGFVQKFSAQLDDFEWKGSLDAFNDILRGGCGTPLRGGFVLVWKHSDRSRTVLGHEAKARWLGDVLQTCHSSNRPSVRARLADAEQGQGPTLFDDLVEIIREHGPGGSEAEDEVELRLL